METRKVSNKPTFPNENTISCKPPDCFGMSKRFYAACAAMQGLLVNYKISIGIPNEKKNKKKKKKKREKQEKKDIKTKSYEIADDLLKQEKKKKKKKKKRTKKK